MLMNEVRPRRFSEVVGQAYPVELLQKVASRPDNLPRIYVIHGPHGTGKTTLARILARALNCERPVKGEPCLTCEQCQSMDGASPYYLEFDCGVSGSVDKIREIRQLMLLDTTMARYRVVVLDEFHMASPEAQSSMLKVFEEMPSRTFVAMCTTEPWKIRETILSRSVEVALNKLSEEELRNLIVRSAEVRGISVSEAAATAIVKAAAGHARDAVKMVDVLAIVGEEKIIAETTSAEDVVVQTLLAIIVSDETKFRAGLKKIAAMMNADVTRAVYSVMEELLDPRRVGDRLAPWKGKALDLFRVTMLPWAVNAMHEDCTMQAFFWALWQMFSEKKMDSGAVVSRFGR